MTYLGINKKFILGLKSPQESKKISLVQGAASPNLVTEPFAQNHHEEESKENLNYGDLSSHFESHRSDVMSRTLGSITGIGRLSVYGNSKTD
jgi:hypothetical protein